MESITLDGKKYISAKQAAEITGYSQDYIGQLVRAGTLPGRLIGRARFVEEGALFQYSSFAKLPREAIPRGEVSTESLTVNLPEEKLPDFEIVGQEIPQEISPGDCLHGWQSRSPLYETEKEIGFEEIKIPIKILQPTRTEEFLKNKNFVFTNLLLSATTLAVFSLQSPPLIFFSLRP